MLDLSVAIVTWNAKKDIDEFLASIYENTKKVTYEIIVADNHSEDGTAHMIREKYPKVILIENKDDGGFAYGINKCLTVSKGRYIVTFTPDTLLLPNALDLMVDFMVKTPTAGACGARLFYADGSPQPSYGYFPTIPRILVNLFPVYKLFPQKLFKNFKRLSVTPSEEINEPIRVDYPSGACLMLRREVVDEVGPMDERFFVYFEETDWCYRMMKAGWDRYYVPDAKVIHYCGSSFKNADMARKIHNMESRLKFFKKNYSVPQNLILSVLHLISSAIFWSFWKLRLLTGMNKTKAREEAGYHGKVLTLFARRA